MGRPLACRTKIVATLGPSSADPATIEKMVAAGMSVARINLAHGTHPEHRAMALAVRRAAKRAGRAVAVMVDLAGPKIRVGDLKGGRVQLEPGRPILLTPERVLGTADRVSVTVPTLARDVRTGDPVFLADGVLELRVTRVRGTDVECEVVQGGLLLPAKGVNVPRTRLKVPSFTAKDRRDLAHALRMRVDAVALSFVRTAADVERIRKIIGRRPVRLVAKIEKAEAVENLESIIDAADGVMVARGDLAVETSTEDLPHLQKRIIRLANDRAKPVITATQMLLSMVESPRPTRAEAADVANAILDGTDAVMLSEETARGRDPAGVVGTMARIAARAEQDIDTFVLVGRTRREAWIAAAVSEAAVQVARQVGAKAIVTPTRRGATPRAVARLRPPMPVVALGEDAAAVQFLCFTWGVLPLLSPRRLTFDASLKEAERELKSLGMLARGDRYVLTAGYPARYASNLMTVQEFGR